jgi:hypothetical protein
MMHGAYSIRMFNFVFKNSYIHPDDEWHRSKHVALQINKKLLLDEVTFIYITVQNEMDTIKLQ